MYLCARKIIEKNIARKFEGGLVFSLSTPVVLDPCSDGQRLIRLDEYKAETAKRKYVVCMHFKCFLS